MHLIVGVKFEVDFATAFLLRKLSGPSGNGPKERIGSLGNHDGDGDDNVG